MLSTFTESSPKPNTTSHSNIWAPQRLLFTCIKGLITLHHDYLILHVFPQQKHEAAGPCHWIALGTLRNYHLTCDCSTVRVQLIISNNWMNVCVYADCWEGEIQEMHSCVFLLEAVVQEGWCWRQHKIKRFWQPSYGSYALRYSTRMLASPVSVVCGPVSQSVRWKRALSSNLI